MRLPFEQWNETLSRLGLRRLVRASGKRLPQRQLQIEPLEPRDMLATVSITAINSTVNEGSAGTFSVSRDASGESLTVNYTLGGTATNGSDYGTLYGTLTMQSLVTTATITISATDDGNNTEGNETVNITLSSLVPQGGSSSSNSYSISSTLSSASMTIIDNSNPIISVAASGSPSETGPTTGAFTISRTGSTANSLSFNYSMSGGATGGGADYSLSGSAVILAGSSSAAITLTPTDDADCEASETAILTLGTSANYGINGAASAATLTIADNDQPLLSVSASGSPAEAGPTNGTYLVTRTGPTTNSLNVAYTMSGGATNGTDYASLSGSVMIMYGSSSAAVTLAPNDDGTVEGDENAVLSLNSSSLYTVNSLASAASLVIADNDGATVSVTSSGSPSETGPTSGNFIIARTGSNTGSLTVNYTLSGVAVNGTDYTGLSGSVVIPAGSASANVTVAPTDDALVEGNEAATLTLNTSGNYTINSSASASTLTIADNDLYISITGYGPASEVGLRPGTFSISRNGATSESLAISYTMSGSATNGTDYTTLGGTVIIPAGQASVPVSLIPTDDGILEGIETAIFTIGSSGTYLASPTHGSGMININDGAGSGTPIESKSDETVICSCLCGCPNVETGYIEKTGALIVQAAGTALRYLSTTLGYQIVSVDVSFDESAEEATSIEARLTFGGLSPVSMFYDPSTLEADTDYRFALQVDASTLGTGRYYWEIELIENYAAQEPVVRIYSGNQEMINAKGSVYGSGWSPTYLDRLVVQADGVSLVQGDGNQFWFDEDGGDYTEQKGDPDNRTLAYNSTSHIYTLTDSAGTVSLFNSAGLLQSREDVFENSMAYAYIDADSDGQTDDLYTVMDSVGRTSTFAYSGGIISTITDFAGRVTTFSHNGSGQITSVVEPDPDLGGPRSAPSSSFSYSSGLVATFTNAASGTTEFGYDHARGLASRTNPNETAKAYTNETTGGVVDPTGGVGESGDPAPLIVTADLAGSQTNELDQTTSYTTGEFGGRLSSTDGLETTTVYVRNDQGQIEEATGVDPDGELGPEVAGVTTFDFDERGNMTQMVGPGDEEHASAIYTWTYHETGNVPVEFTIGQTGEGPLPLLRWTIYTLDEGTGAVLSQRQVIGQPDDEFNEETDDILELFTYTAAPAEVGDPPAGLLATYIDGNGHQTDYFYNEHGLVTEIVFAVGTADEASIGFEYNSLDQLTAEVDELGRRTEHTYSKLDELLSTTLPDPDGAPTLEEENPLESPVYTWTYNAMRHVSIATDSIGRETAFTYGAFGNMTGQTLSGDGFDDVTVGWGYDDAGRMISQTDGLDRTTFFTLDALGQLLETVLPDPDGPGEGHPLTSPSYSTVFDPLSRPILTTDVLGNETSIVYSDFGRTVTITLPDPDGPGEGHPLESPVYVQSFDLLGQLVSQTDPLGRITSYERDQVGRTVAVVLPDPDAELEEYESAELHYTYDKASNLVSVEDAMGNVTLYVFDARDRLVEMVLPDPDGPGEGNPLTSPEYHWVFDAASQLTSETDPLGRTIQHLYDNLGREIETVLPDPDGSGEGHPLASPHWYFSYDAASRLVSTTSPLGFVTENEYDLVDNLVTLVLPDPDGPGEGHPLASPEYHWVFDAASQLISETDSLGRTTEHVLDNLGREIVTVLPDPDGSGEGHPLASPRWYFSYDANSNLVSQTDPMGNVTTRTLDALGRLVAMVLPDPDGSGEGHPLTSPEFHWIYDAASQLESETDPLGRTTLHTFDGMGREIETVLPDPDGSGEGNPLESPVWQFRFDANNHLISQTDPNGNVTARTLDNLGRLLALVLPDPDGSGEGHPLASPEFHWVYDASSQITSETDAMGRTTQHVFDNLGREIETVLPDPDGPGEGHPLPSPAWHFSFDAENRLISQVNPADEETQFGYDNLSRRISITDAEEGVTQFAFDPVGNLISLTDPETNVTQWFYDNLNRVIEEENELSDSRFFQYDVNSNLIEKTDRNERVTQYVHDNLNRTIRENWLGGESVVNAINYSFDAGSQLEAAGDDFSAYSFSFDNLGRVTSVDNDGTPAMPHVILASTFDALGNRTKLAVSVDDDDDFVNDYSLDNLSRVTRIAQYGVVDGNDVAEKRVDVAYNAAGQYDTIDRYADLAGTKLVASSAYEYDGIGRLTSLAHSHGETPLAGYVWTFDVASRIETVDSLLDGLSTFSYDATSQLTGADHETQADEAHVWDANGNPDGEDFDVEANNRLMSDADFDYLYDDEGNRTRKTDKITGDYVAYGWDYRNRLTSVEFYDDEDELQKRVEYDYDVFDRRIAKRVDSDGDDIFDSAQKFVYDGEDIVLVFDDTGSLTNRLFHGPGIDEVFADEQFIEGVLHDTYWSLADNLGTVRDVAAHDAVMEETEIVKHLTLNSFGQIIDDSATGLKFLYSFTGREWDADAQL